MNPQEAVETLEKYCREYNIFLDVHAVYGSIDGGVKISEDQFKLCFMTHNKNLTMTINKLEFEFNDIVRIIDIYFEIEQTK